MRARTQRMLDVNGKRSIDSFHRELGLLLWDKCGMARNAAGLREALARIPEIREEFWRDVRVPGTGEEFNQSLERGGRVADFLEFGELMCTDALERDESCGGHFREEHQTPDGEALRDDANYAAVFAWEYQGNGAMAAPKLHREPLHFESVELAHQELQMNFKLKVWRQKNGEAKGKFVEYEARDVSPNTSFLETLDLVNEQLTERGEEPIAFDSDCREGICGTCSLTINGEAHGPDHPGAACQLYMRSFKDGATIMVEPFRARPFKFVKDLVVDRSALDRIVQAGGFVAARAGSAPEANSIPVPKHQADLAMEAAACIGCGACAAACPNASAMLFTSAKVSHLALLPQGKPERTSRAS